jgi:hypothetical protein
MPYGNERRIGMKKMAALFIAVVTTILVVSITLMFNGKKKAEVVDVPQENQAPVVETPVREDLPNQDDSVVNHDWKITCSDGVTYSPDRGEINFEAQYARFLVNGREIDCSTYVIKDEMR